MLTCAVIASLVVGVIGFNLNVGLGAFTGAVILTLARAADEATQIPGTSALSLWKMRQDLDWIQRLDASNPGSEDIRRLERLSIRMQCLLADFSGCFLI